MPRWPSACGMSGSCKSKVFVLLFMSSGSMALQCQKDVSSDSVRKPGHADKRHVIRVHLPGDTAYLRQVLEKTLRAIAMSTADLQKSTGFLPGAVPEALSCLASCTPTQDSAFWGCVLTATIQFAPTPHAFCVGLLSIAKAVARNDLGSSRVKAAQLACPSPQLLEHGPGF